MNLPEESGNRTSSSCDAFISYASADAAVANSIVESLESHGLKCWMAPRDVKPGAQYADAIVRAINDAKAVVLVMSGSAVASSHVGKEIERASSKRKPIIAFRIDAAPLNHALEYFLSESQWIDVKALEMPAALAKLNESVGQGAAAPSQQTVPTRPTRGVGRRVVFPGAIVIALGVAIVVGIYFWVSKHNAQTPAAAAITDKSIAVLPFVDMSEKRDQEYFGDGMAEEIIDLLVKYPELKVISRTSSFQFKGQASDLRTMGAKLGVSYVLEGSVRKSGDHLRVTAQLINAQDGTHLWSQTYDRDLSDVLKMQDEIAARIVRALQVEVTPEGLDVRAVLRNNEAYTLYLQGLHAFNHFDQQGYEEAQSDFQRALELDPTFAAAANMLAGTYRILGQRGSMPAAAALEQARHAEELALKLDPNLAAAHAGLAIIYMANDWDWSSAERELKLARTLAPNDALILYFNARYSLIIGRWDDAMRLVNASLARDPLNPGSYVTLAFAYMRRGQVAEAETAMRRALEISPTHNYAHSYLGDMLLARGQSDAALAEMLREQHEGARIAGSAMAYFTLKRKAESDSALAKLLNGTDNLDAFRIAGVYAYRREIEEAFKWLDRAYEQKNVFLYTVKISVPLDNLHSDPRYKAFLKKMNLPE